MAEKLFEADYVTINLNNVIKSNSNKNTYQNQNKSNTTDENSSKNNNPKNIIWEQELEKRLKANSKLGTGKRQSDYEVELQFFEDFFKAMWGKQLGEKLISFGKPIMNIFKILGYSEHKNPMYKFLMLDYVKTELLATKLINPNTFRVLYNVLAEKLTSVSEFMDVNTYNLIYCRDLYRRSATEMSKYLKLQSKILTNAADKKNQNANIKAFLVRNSSLKSKINTDAVKEKNVKLEVENLPAMTDSSAKLNSYEQAEKLSGNVGYSKTNDVTADGEDNNNKNKKLTDKQKLFIDTILKGKDAEKLAALQLLSVSTNNASAKKALKNSKFSSVTAQELLNATEQISKIWSKTALPNAVIDKLVKQLMES